MFYPSLRRSLSGLFAPMSALVVLSPAHGQEGGSATAPAAASGAPTETRESVEIEPYTGPPIFLPEGEAPPPPSEVESRVVTEKFPESDKPRFERGMIRFSDDTVVSDGLHKEYYSSGQLYVSGEFRRGKASGKWTFHHPDGQVAKEVEYKDGRPVGEVKVLNPEGKLVSRREYAEDGGRAGVWETYSADGATKLREETYRDGKANGTFRLWYTNGQLRQESTFADGKLEGLATEWTRVGDKRAEVMFKAGLKDGPTKIWQADGKVVEQTYEAGRLIPAKG